MSNPLERVLVRHPSLAFVSQTFLNERWKTFGYTACPDFLQACRDFDKFIAVLEKNNVHVSFLEGLEDASPDSIYVHDPAETIGNGFILCRMGKKLRRNESERFRVHATQNGIPVLGQITGPGLLEGGDIIWLDDRTLAVGEGYRSNREGIDQLTEIAAPFVDQVISVPLPHWRGKSDVLHLMSLISPVAEKVAAVFKPFLPVPFLQELERREFTLIDIPEDELDTLGCNILPVAPDVCIMADGNSESRRRLESAGIRVETYPAAEISLKGQGGPTCLTRPLLRAAPTTSTSLRYQRE